MPAHMIPYSLPPRAEAWQLDRGEALLAEMLGRRSCRAFSDRPVPRDVLAKALAVGHTAPSGANRKAWRFVCVSEPALKREIRLAAEREERENYDRRFPPEWLEALEPIGTNADKGYLEVAPWLVVVFRIDYEMLHGEKVKNYYPMESVCLAAGFFLMAAHQLGLATLTHTPSPMTFLRDLLGRPQSERPILLIPVGYPAEDCRVPDLPKKPVEQAVEWR